MGGSPEIKQVAQGRFVLYGDVRDLESKAQHLYKALKGLHTFVMKEQMHAHMEYGVSLHNIPDECVEAALSLAQADGEEI